MPYSLSVIIPCFNRASFLSRAIDSVLSQKMVDDNLELQVIVIDDGSTDQTSQLIAEHYPMVDYCYQQNKGVSAARNLGLKMACNEWVALLDSDDEWLPYKVQRQFDLLKQSNLLLCHTQEIWVRNGARINQMKKHAKKGGWIFQDCLPLCAMSPSSTMIHNSIFEQVGVFDESLPACEDYDMWLRITANYEVSYLDSPFIIKYGGHVDQLSRQFWGMDRFRVLALEKILYTDLNESNRKAALTMLTTKLNILLAGAIKHNNINLISECQTKLAMWEPHI